MRIVIDIPEIEKKDGSNVYSYDPCEKCMNNPRNNPYASGVCNCVLPYMHGKQKIKCNTTAEYPYLGTSWTYSTTNALKVTLKG